MFTPVLELWLRRPDLHNVSRGISQSSWQLGLYRLLPTVVYLPLPHVRDVAQGGLLPAGLEKKELEVLQNSGAQEAAI